MPNPRPLRRDADVIADHHVIGNCVGYAVHLPSVPNPRLHRFSLAAAVSPFGPASASRMAIPASKGDGRLGLVTRSGAVVNLRLQGSTSVAHSMEDIGVIAVRRR